MRCWVSIPKKNMNCHLELKLNYRCLQLLSISLKNKKKARNNRFRPLRALNSLNLITLWKPKIIAKRIHSFLPIKPLKGIVIYPEKKISRWPHCMYVLGILKRSQSILFRWNSPAEAMSTCELCREVLLIDAIYEKPNWFPKSTLILRSNSPWLARSIGWLAAWSAHPNHNQVSLVSWVELSCHKGSYYSRAVGR